MRFKRFASTVIRCVPVIVACLLTTVRAELANPPSQVRKAAEPAPAFNSGLPLRQVIQTFRELGQGEPIHLNGIDGYELVSFGLRQDEVVVKARLKLRYSYSPSMIPELSHIKVSLNDEVLATIPLPKELAGSEQIREVELDNLYLSDFNQLKFQLIGHYTMECEDVLHSSLWANISDKSQLELTVQPIDLHNDLSILPLPFFDFHDNRRLNLPFVFAAKPSRETLQASGMVSSWFGALASYRGARFPSLLNQLPAQNAIVFATTDEIPAGITLPVIEGPSIILTEHPQQSGAKLLLLLGRSGAELQQAASALVLGQAVLSGQLAHVDKVNYPPRRAAYDAPNWLAVDRPVKIGELVDSPDQLQVRGRLPRPLRVNVRVPADLMLWQNKGVPIDLKYRYTPPVAEDNSTVNVSINNQFLKTIRLQPDAKVDEVENLMLPLREDDRSLEHGDLLIPSLKVGSDNQLQFQFAFDYHKQGMCRSFQLDNVWAALEPNSVIDFSHFYHYSEMPNLSFFANSGFPYTKYADLAETAVILPKTPTATDIEAYLTALGLMGKSTGMAGLRFQLLGPDDLDAAADRDLLLIDTSPKSDLLAGWQDRLPVSLRDQQRSFLANVMRWKAYENLDRQVENNRADDPTVLRTDGQLSLLVGFESPLQNGRSAIALMASDPGAANKLLQGLQDSGRISHIGGDVAFFRGDTVESSRQGPIYYVGELPVWHWIWFHLAKHPLLLALMAISSGLFVAFLCYAGLKKIVVQRLKS